MDDAAHRAQLRLNYTAFEAQLPILLATRAGQFALLRAGDIVQFYPTAGEAAVAGREAFTDGSFSVQEVIAIPLNLGFYSHALP